MIAYELKGNFVFMENLKSPEAQHDDPRNLADLKTVPVEGLDEKTIEMNDINEFEFFDLNVLFYERKEETITQTKEGIAKGKVFEKLKDIGTKLDVSVELLKE